MANPARGIDHWQAITATLNDTIINTGKKIDINNPTIWGEYLHRWDNSDWLDILSAFDAVLQQRPDLMRPFHKRNYENAITVLNLGKDISDRVLDKKANKKIAWAMIMTLREVLNELNEVNLPNEDALTKQQQRRHKVVIEQTEEYTRTTVWHNLFDIED